MNAKIYAASVVVACLGCDQVPRASADAPVRMSINGKQVESTDARVRRKPEGFLASDPPYYLGAGLPLSNRLGNRFRLHLPLDTTLGAKAVLVRDALSVQVNEVREDYGVGIFTPPTEQAFSLVVERYERATRRISGRFSGTLVVMPHYNDPRYDGRRFLPDTLRIADGRFDVALPQ